MSSSHSANLTTFPKITKVDVKNTEIPDHKSSPKNQISRNDKSEMPNLKQSKMKK